MPQPRVVVFGYGELAIAAFDTLEWIGVAPAAVVVPGNRRGADVELIADRTRARGLTLLSEPPRASMAPFLDALRSIEPEVLLVWSYSMILPAEVLALPRLGAVNVHGGLLPEYRGGHVMNWALINGEHESGVTLHYMDAGIDTGPIIAQKRFTIDRCDDAASVREKLKGTGQTLLERWWPSIAEGTAPRIPQDETRARYYPMRNADDGEVDWTMSSDAIYNLVRALVAPWPGAFTSVDGRRLVLRRVERSDAVGRPAHAPGTVTSSDAASICVATGSGTVALAAVEIDGRPATAADLVRVGVTVGKRLGQP